MSFRNTSRSVSRHSTSRTRREKVSVELGFQKRVFLAFFLSVTGEEARKENMDKMDSEVVARDEPENRYISTLINGLKQNSCRLPVMKLKES